MNGPEGRLAPAPDPSLILERRFRAAATAAGLPVDESDRLWNPLAAAYDGPDRHYHNLDHLTDMLDLLDACMAEMPARSARGAGISIESDVAREVSLADHPALVLAVCYHDAVYDSRASGNEAASAGLALRDLVPHAPALAERVAVLVRLTAHGAGNPAAGDEEAALLLDADLAVLGRDPEGFAAYAAAIRREYAWVPETDYRQGRARVLCAFLDRPAVYRTPWFASRFEAKARANLARELASLRE